MEKAQKKQNSFSRRSFFAATTGMSIASGLALNAQTVDGISMSPVRQWGPASKVKPVVKAAFVRRRGEYGMYWPGAVYNGRKAREQYTRDLRKAEKELNLKIDLRPEPVYSIVEAKKWVDECKKEKPDGLLVLLQDRQQHSWPTVSLATDSGIPTVVHSPLGTSFTTNTARYSEKKGCVICATDDFSEVAFCLKMIQAHCKLDATRFIVIRGRKRMERKLAHLGTTFQYIPASDFLNEYKKTEITDEIKQLSKDYIKNAIKIVSGTYEDVVNGMKSYTVVKKLLALEKGDGISMDCLGILANKKMSLPCIAWSHMLDHGIPAACEADLGACLTHAFVLYLFNKPGFQQDPVADTSNGTLIGAHCTCATRLCGLDKPPIKYDIRHHHGNRDAVPRPVWEIGQRITVADILPVSQKEKPLEMIISEGQVVENRSAPPAGGCVVSVECKLDGVTNCLDYPGFHQIFFLGDHKRQLLSYCKLYSIEPIQV